MLDPDAILINCDTAKEGAALGLLALMAGISEEYWCAAWISGLEYELWQADAGQKCGQGVITERQAALLRLLSEECGGWWAGAGRVFVPMETWVGRLSNA
jgi:hypothetical protein